MPIACPIQFPRLSTDEFRRLDYRVMKHVFDCHNTLGRLGEENVYQADVAARLMYADFQVARELPVVATFGAFTKTYRLDLVVNERAIYELKAVTCITNAHRGQLLNYLLMLDCGHGKVANLRPSSVESSFVNAPLTTSLRRNFQIEDADWRGGQWLRDWLVELLRDWGTGLSVSLYHRAVVHFLGGSEAVTRLIPMRRGKVKLGTQRFYLLEPDAPFRITAFDEATPSEARQLMKLLAYTELRAVHWINISLHRVTFVTLDR